MLKLSDKEKQILLYLITNCEIYQLNESEALKYIKHKFSKTISRRLYYNYKKIIYKDHTKNSPYFRLFKNIRTPNSKNWISISLRAERERIIQNGIKQKNMRLEEFSKLDDFKIFFKKMFVKTELFIENSQQLLDKLNSKRESEIEKSKSIPDKATIREEYIKCGKEFCLRCNHGPYFYAYLRDDNGKLKKKYIGKRDPREESYKNDLEQVSVRK